MKVQEILKRGLIVSCQALEDEPLHSSFIMSRLAVAAKDGGAIGIRANTPKDIKAIRNSVELPIIGIIKKEYEGSDVYITPTFKEVKKLVKSGTEIIAIDATLRKRPGKYDLKKLVKKIRKKFPDIFLMADVSNLEEGKNAIELEFDLIATTLAGYTEYTKGCKLPDFSLMRELSNLTNIPIIGEGGIWTTEDAKKAFDAGVYAIVVGSAITRPQLITKRFADAIKNCI